MIGRVHVLGAGGIGGGVGGLLARAGVDVTLVARGDHAAALRDVGLRVGLPRGGFTRRLPVVDRADPAPGDLVLLATKLGDAEAALATLPRPSTVVCLTNGVLAERLATAAGHRALGAMVYVPAVHLEPGVVALHGTPDPGVVDVGAWPRGESPLAAVLAKALRGAGLRSWGLPDIARWKWAKLLLNLGGAVDARVQGGMASPQARAAVDAAVAEGVAVLAAAGVDHAGVDGLLARVGRLGVAPIDGVERGGGSTWQSAARGRPLEVPYLNGELVRMGAVHGVPTPVNAALVALAAEDLGPRALAPEALAARCGL